MKKLFLIALSAALVAGAVPARAAEETGVDQVLTLDLSLQRAFQNNHKLLEAQNDIKISQQRVREARSGLYPQVSLHMNASRYLAEQNYVLPAEFGSTILRPSKDLEPDNFYSARAWLKQPLYSGGRINNTVKLAEANLERARIQYEEIRAEAIYETTRSFDDVLLARKRIELAQAALKKINSLTSNVRARNGDRLRASALKSRLRRELSDRKREAEKANMDFLRALGLELYTRVKLDGDLGTRPVEADLAKLLAWAHESRLEIRQTDYQREIDRLTLNLSQAERYPVIALGAGYELNDRTFPLKSTQWSATLNFSLPIFDGFSSRARIREKRLQVNQGRIQRTQIEDAVNLEVREAYSDLEHWQDELKARRDELDSMEREAASAKGDALARAEDEEMLLEARGAYWTAVHGHLVALAKMERAVGRPLEF